MPTHAPQQWNPALAAAAWIVPGLGHWLMGERRRGAILGASIGILWLTGLLIGGISAIHLPRRGGDQFLTLFQPLLAPSLLVGYYHETLKQAGDAPPPGEQAVFEPSYGRVNEIGVLYTALAGLLNLLTIIDVIYRDPTPVPERRGESIDLSKPPAPGAPRATGVGR